MASVQDIKEQLRSVIEIGRTNLAEKGVICAENANVCDIMQGIADCKVGDDIPSSEGVEFGTDATYEEKYAVLSESLNEIARRTQTMAGTNKAMTLEDIIYWLGRVIYLAQGWAESEFALDFDTDSDGILPIVVNGYATSTFGLNFETSAT